MQNTKQFPLWTDIVSVNKEDLIKLAQKHHLHPSSIQDCLDPEHFPKIEKLGETLFLMVRYYDKQAPADADELLALTRKIAFFVKPDLLLTIHRAPADFLGKIREQWLPEEGTQSLPLALMIKIVKECIKSYDPLLEKVENDLFSIEKDMLQKKMSPTDLIQLYRCRTRLSVVKRLFWHTMATLQQWRKEFSPTNNPWLQDLEEISERYFLYADELLEDSQNLLNLHISLSSQKTNETMRILTVLSFFFLPLTFIVGVYGMNFKFMPELDWRWGYPAVWGALISISVFIYVKVKRKGWLD